MILNPYTFTTNDDTIKTLQQLSAGESKLSDIFAPDENGVVKIGNLALNSGELADVLDVKIPENKTAGLILQAQARAEKMLALSKKRADSMAAQLEKKARQTLVKSPMTKSAVAFAELVEEVRGLEILANPLGELGVSAGKTKDAAQGTVYQLRLLGTALTSVREGETNEQAFERLKAMIADDSSQVAVMAGMKPTKANLSAVRHGVFKYPNAPEGQVGVRVGYSINFADVQRLIKCAKALSEFNGKQVPVLNASIADAETIRLNLNDDQLSQQLEEEATISPEELAAAI